MSELGARMRASLEKYAIQFAYQPKIENAESFTPKSRFVVCGMGGSNQASELIKRIDPTIDMITHRAYGLPVLSEKQWEDRLVIVSSHSGNTEEVLEALTEAQKKELPIIILSTGGKLLELAKQHTLPSIEIPDDDFEPRMAMGFQMRALAHAMGREDILTDSEAFGKNFDPMAYESRAKELAEQITGKIPLIYASNQNWIFAYRLKITLNETGKSMAFYNLVPEMNHNEIEGFTPGGNTSELLGKTHVIQIRDNQDHERVTKRMDVFGAMVHDAGGTVTDLELQGTTIYEKIFSTLLTGGWTAYHLATQKGIDPQDVPTIESFKKQILQ